MIAKAAAMTSACIACRYRGRPLAACWRRSVCARPAEPLRRDPALPSSFRVGAAAQASIAAVGLAAAELRHRAGAARQAVSVDMRHAAIEFRSEHYLTIDGNAPATMFDPLFGAYRTGDGRFVRLHMNFPHHRENVLKLLGCAPTRASIEEALGKWEAVAFETEAYQRGCVVAAMRSPAEWAAHPQAAAVAAMPAGADRKDRRRTAASAAAGRAATVRASRARFDAHHRRPGRRPRARRARCRRDADFRAGSALYRLAGEGHRTRQAVGLRRYRHA